MTLDVEVFRHFYTEVNGVEPFPWQADIVESVLTRRSWPSLVDVPTGLGKTAMIDIAVFVAAATAGEQDADRLGRRRTLLIVDRRIVVDEAFERARTLSAALDRSLAGDEDSATRRVARGLRALAPTAGEPLRIPGVDKQSAPPPVLPVTRMRGGVTWDAAWLDRPDVPAVVVGTVDQLGSRLLFRGYGVSDKRKPIDAALVGMDSLILVDEAHLAEVLVSTLMEAQSRDGARLGVPLATLVQLTATPSGPTGSVYSFDVAAHREHPEAWRRLTASKRLELLASDVKSVVAELAGAARQMIAGGADTVLVVCNTVGRARQVHATLVKMTAARDDPLDADVDLLIGRSRPADREVVVEAIRNRFGVGRSRPAHQRPALLVATQTVEVGANLDVDALVTESAPWDAIVQRLGRLNRLGVVAAARATVVHDGADDSVYGLPRAATWSALADLDTDAHGGLDVSPLACRVLGGSIPPEALATRPAAPVVLAPVLDAWVRTGPIPLPDVPVAPYLHGIDRRPATVSIAWREGMIEPDPASDDLELPHDEIDSDLRALPILPSEIVEVPIHAARAWLRGEAALPVSDLEDVDAPAVAKPRRVAEPFRAVAWRSDGKGGASGGWQWVEAQEIRPGDVLVVPVERGGLDRYGWAPDSSADVLDVADAARFAATGAAWRRRLRADASTPRRLGLDAEKSGEWRQLLRAAGSDDAAGDAMTAMAEWLAAAIERKLADDHAERPPGERLPATAWTSEALATLRAWIGSGVEVSTLAQQRRGEEGPASYGRRPGEDRFVMTAMRTSSRAIERDDELVECSSMATRQVSLRVHHRHVGDRARDIAAAVGLPADVAASVEVAARWHDLGKTEPRFQAMLCGGDRFDAMLLDEPLAKSGLDPEDRVAWQLARVRSKLPARARHEAWSSAIVRTHLAGQPAVGFDPDLVVHLVASHHGHARPWLPAVVDENPVEITVGVDEGLGAGPDAKVTIRTDQTVDFGHPLRFANLNRRYGRWGLALLETIVRCADMTVSSEGS